jgi:serine/threonine protein kinase
MSSDHSSISRQIQNDKICDVFEAAWEQCLEDRVEGCPCLEDYLVESKGAELSLLLGELLAVELAYRNQRGEHRPCEDYLRRFPGHQETVREVYTRFSGQELVNSVVEVPEKIGRYTVLGLVDSGSFGAVYRAFDDTLQRDVAIKVPHRDRLSRPEDLDTYLTEARILAGLRHPHIVLVHDVASSDDGQFLIVSQFVEGTNLAERLATGRPSHRESACWIASIADALHYAHTRGLVHRDVKPANILLDAEETPYLADFGLALTEEDYGQRGPQGGTIVYMSPEQARGEGHLVDGRSDIFSLGAVFYELLTGMRPFRGVTWREVLDRITMVDPRPPRMLDDTIPRDLEWVCLKALAKKAPDRYTVAKDMASDLQDFVRAEKSTTMVSATEARPAESIKKIVPKGLRSFDAEDADFFLELVPGPRCRGGLPNSIRFWKNKIEASEQEDTFRVGLIYGPSGCGKSSLIKAGLVPNLSSRVFPVYVESTSSDTERCLLHGVRKSFPDVPPDADLVQALTHLRRADVAAPQKKVLIILDQFEQWLHAQRGKFDGVLVRALRQCDGEHLQCIVMVRDDFWLQVSDSSTIWRSICWKVTTRPLWTCLINAMPAKCWRSSVGPTTACRTI